MAEASVRPCPERLALIKDQAFREQLIADGKAMQLAEHIGQPLSRQSLAYRAKNIREGQRGTTKLRPSTGPIVSSSRQSRWRAPGRDLVRLQLESDGQGFFHVRFVNED
ncbi:MAG: hypothetical protein CM15mP120_08800 [Pseudomonadota bacterium]|nr:MAG: hypothetical protein CM15mP120_08800 [Pseudomonadota bacterium]